MMDIFAPTPERRLSEKHIYTQGASFSWASCLCVDALTYDYAGLLESDVAMTDTTAGMLWWTTAERTGPRL
jgi:hypothetical protein